MSKSSNNAEVVDLGPFLTPIAVILGSIIVASAVFFSVSSLKGNVDLGSSDTSGTKTADNNDAGDNTVVPSAPEEAYPETAVGIDDDPYLGNLDTAKVALVEFSDFECPYCQRFHEQTFDQIVDNYIASGELVFVYRDFPLDFHNPAATREAHAGECAQELLGNEKFFSYAQQIYANTASNGGGISDEKMAGYIKDLGGDSAAFTTCLDSGKYDDEVASDIAEGSAAGINGTPGFVVGTLDGDGNVTGISISGAQPYSVFESKINEFLGS